VSPCSELLPRAGSEFCDLPFFQEVKLIFPNGQRMNRGKHDIGALVQASKANGVTDLLIVHEHSGIPGQTTEHLCVRAGRVCMCVQCCEMQWVRNGVCACAVGQEGCVCVCSGSGRVCVRVQCC